MIEIETNERDPFSLHVRVESCAGRMASEWQRYTPIHHLSFRAASLPAWNLTGQRQRQRQRRFAAPTGRWQRTRRRRGVCDPFATCGISFVNPRRSRDPHRPAASRGLLLFPLPPPLFSLGLIDFSHERVCARGSARRTGFSSCPSKTNGTYGESQRERPRL